MPKLSKTQIYSEALSSANFKPVIKTFADHQGAIRSLAFHPFTPILTSASVDATIKFMDISKTDTYRYALGQITVFFF